MALRKFLGLAMPRERTGCEMNTRARSGRGLNPRPWVARALYRFQSTFRFLRLLFTATMALCLMMVPPFSRAQRHPGSENQKVQSDHATWMQYGEGPDSSHFEALNQITKSNVSRLRVAWNYPTSDRISYLFNPIVVDGMMYVLARENSLVALDATTGREIWIHANLGGIATHGVAYWANKDGADKRIIYSRNSFLEEIDAHTGKSIITFGNRGVVDLRQELGRDPRTVYRIQTQTPGRVFENLIIMGSATGEGYMSPPGDIRAYNVITGDLVWTFHTIPHPGEFGYDTWPKNAWKYVGGVNCWGEISVDEKLGIAYIPVGSPTFDYYGADRTGDGLFGTTLLALDARTGRRLWHYQLVHHDLWDSDPTSAPQLLVIKHNGKQREVVAEAGKTGFLYVFDRRTGEPIWPIEERPVSKSEVPNEVSSPTQPFPTAPPPFGRQQMAAEDIDPYLLTPDERAAVRKILATKDGGAKLFTPPALNQDTIALPGARGASNWGSTAADPANGLVFVISQDWPSIYHLGLEDPYSQPNPGERWAPGTQRQDTGEATYHTSCQACHGADRSGSALAPSLVDVTSRMSLEAFSRLVLSGRGEMPSFSNLSGDSLKALFAFLRSSNGEAVESPEEKVRTDSSDEAGPVVESGGPPGEAAVSPSDKNQYTFMSGPPYPQESDVSPTRYYTGYGFAAHIIRPPWSSLVAYDLNKGIIKWRVPLGEDAEAVSQGAKNTGTFGSRSGAAVAAGGIVFVAARDGKLRAYDENDGTVLWTTTLPASSEGIPTIYEAQGHLYLVVSASSSYSSGRRPSGAGTPPRPDPKAGGLRPGYVAFALPSLSRRKEISGGTASKQGP
jgi:quinoprotein glucose dehydrogenase